MESPLQIIQEQLGEAIHASKCRRCGCLHKTVESLASTEAGRNELAVFQEAKSVLCRRNTTVSDVPCVLPPLPPTLLLRSIRKLLLG